MDLGKSAFRVGIGTIFAQLISSVALLVIPHLYKPDEFGEFTIVLALSTVFLPFATLKIEVLSTVTKSNEESSFLFWFVKRLSFLVSCTSSLIACTYLTFTVEFTTQKIIVFSLAVATMVYIQSLAIISVQMQIREKKLTKVSISGVLQNGITLISQIALTNFSSSSTSLVLGYLVGRALAVYVLSYRAARGVVYKLRQINPLAIRHLVSPVQPLFFGSVLDAVTLSMPILYVENFFKSDHVGTLGLVQSIMLVPITLAGIVFSSTLFSRADEIRAMGYADVQKWFNEKFGKIFKVLLVAYVIFSAVFLPAIFQMLLNDSWKVSSDLIFSFLIYSIGILIMIPILNITIIFGYFQKIRDLALLKFAGGVLSLTMCNFLNLGWTSSVDIFLVVQSIISTIVFWYSRSRFFYN